MRCWHNDLIPVLPRQQLLGQWRECCLIAKNIAEEGTPNHILVNRIMDYPIEHFIAYSTLVKNEMKNKGYKCDVSRFTKWLNWKKFNIYPSDIFEDWHNERYLRQCLFNLEEKAICGGIPLNEWNVIYSKFGEEYDLWCIHIN